MSTHDLNDAELLRRAKAARTAAHEAPRSLPGSPSSAFAVRAAEFADLWLEAKRRGLSLANIDAIPMPAERAIR